LVCGGRRTPAAGKGLEQGLGYVGATFTGAKGGGPLAMTERRDDETKERTPNFRMAAAAMKRPERSPAPPRARCWRASKSLRAQADLRRAK